MNAWINNIQRFSIHDGPGIRTTVFFQGCNLRCQWCHNPDTISMKPVFRYIEKRCIKCGACVRKCEDGALRWEERPFWREKACVSCGACQKACPVQACSLSAKKMTSQEIMDVVLRDKPFYDSSGGGITCSGGEPVISTVFLYDLLNISKKYNIHTAVDTAAALSWEHYETLLPVTDLFLVDYKHEDDTIHRKNTGMGNRLIRDNLRRFAICGKPVIIRIPVIPEFNADDSVINAMAVYLNKIKFKGTVELLKLHHLGEDKYKSLDLPYKFAGIKQPEEEDIKRYCAIFLNYGIIAVDQ